MEKLIYTLAILLNLSYDCFGQLKSSYYPERGLHLSGGLHSAVPTSGILFPAWRASESTIQRQTLLSEWYSPRMGGYLEGSFNVGNNRPFYIGFQHNWQRLFKNAQHLQSIDPDYPNVGNHYLLSKRARLNNQLFFGEGLIYSHKKFQFYGRGEFGFGTYKEQNKIHAVGSYHALNSLTSVNTVFTAGLGLSFRYQATERLALRLNAGYQMQSINYFKRRSYFSGLQGYIESTEPNFFDTEISESPGFNRPLRPQNEYLFLQVGVVHRFDGRNFFYSRGERGEPTYDPANEKPILYLYPENTIEVDVTIRLTDHEFIFTYPEISENSSWSVIAEPNGKLYHSETDRNYYSLFWETKGKPFATNLEQGFVVSKNEVRAFLENKLNELGLNYKEANEFLIYWLPRLEVNEYNAIYFAFDEYEAMSKLEITPKPDTLIRVMMMFEPLNKPIDLVPQMLPETPSRKGFVAVEWGGMEGQFFKHSLP